MNDVPITTILLPLHALATNVEIHSLDIKSIHDGKLNLECKGVVASKIIQEYLGQQYLLHQPIAFASFGLRR
jgi:hypothetical protein